MMMKTAIQVVSAKMKQNFSIKDYSLDGRIRFNAISFDSSAFFALLYMSSIRHF